MKAIRRIVSGALAGILIAIGGSVFLSSDRIVGAIFFSVALLCICLKGYALFTGKIGFIPEKHDGEAFSVLLWGLLGNLIATVGVGLAIRYAMPTVGAAAEGICAAKLEQVWWQTLVRGILCGILMYLAVSIYRDRQTVVAIFFCVPVFILAGFEHSIANMFYFGVAGMLSLRSALYVGIVILGNAIGGMLLPILERIAAPPDKN